MYPDNYMNPMNNPMTNPNYGYNRMQQVQQMQRAINPQENKIEYVTSNDFNGLNQRVQNIENFLNQLGGQQNESNANDASIQPTPANVKSSNGNAAHVRK